MFHVFFHYNGITNPNTGQKCNSNPKPGHDANVNIFYIPNWNPNPEPNPKASPSCNASTKHQQPKKQKWFNRMICL